MMRSKVLLALNKHNPGEHDQLTHGNRSAPMGRNIEFGRGVDEEKIWLNPEPYTTSGEESDAGSWGTNLGFEPPTYSSKQLESLAIYQGAYYRGINASLRNNTPTTYKPFIDAIDSMMLATSEPITVYRGLLLQDKAQRENFKKGKRFTDRGYSSTSINKRVAQKFAPPENPRSLTMKIHVPKKAKALPAFLIKNVMNEDEIILSRNTTYEVISDIDADGQFEVKVVS